MQLVTVFEKKKTRGWSTDLNALNNLETRPFDGGCGPPAADMQAGSAIVVPTDIRGTIATRIGEAEERLRSSIAARINRNRAELARLQADEAEFAQCIGSKTSSPGVPTPTGGASALSPRPEAKQQSTLAKEADSTAAALHEAIAAHSKVAAGARTPPTAPASVSRLGLLGEAEGGDGGDGGAGAPLLLRMTVEIGDGRVGAVEVHEGDSYEELAADFC